MKLSPRTPHQLTPNVKLLHKVALIWQGKVLLVRRDAQASSRPEKWDIPGGNSEWPTDLDQSIRNPHMDDVTREVLEETRLLITPETFTIDTLVHFETYFDVEKQIFSIVCGWGVELVQDEEPPVELSDEHTEYVWAPLEDLSRYDFGFAEFIPQIITAART